MPEERERERERDRGRKREREWVLLVEVLVGVSVNDAGTTTYRLSFTDVELTSMMLKNSSLWSSTFSPSSPSM